MRGSGSANGWMSRKQAIRAMIECDQDNVPTLYLFFYVVEYEVQQLIKSLEHACHCLPRGGLRENTCGVGEGERTFTSTCKFYTNTRIDVLGKVKNRFPFGFVEGWLGTLRPAVASSTRRRSASLSSSGCATTLGRKRVQLRLMISFRETGGGDVLDLP